MDLLRKLDDVLALGAELAPGDDRPLETVIDEVLGPTEVVVAGRRTLVFGSNNYFGLTFHPEVLAAARAALDAYGSATTGSRIANGTLALHRALEADLAAAFGYRHAAVFTTGYQANLAMLGALCAPDDFVLLDAECHASLFDAARLSGATSVGFHHNSADSLARRLARLPGEGGNRLVVVEGLYSIRGDTSPLREIADACRAGGAYLLVDEAHSLGVYGCRGLGLVEAEGLLDRADFIVGTFSKALAGVGGFAVSRHPQLDAIRLAARPYLFTASGSPANIAGVRAALALILRDRGLNEALWHAVHRLRAGLTALGFEIGATPSPIIPVLAGGAAAAVAWWRRLLASGLYVNIVLPPACHADACLLRLSCSAGHTDAQVDRALEILAACRDSR